MGLNAGVQESNFGEITVTVTHVAEFESKFNGCHAQVGPFYALLAHSAISLRTPTLRRCRSWPPATFQNFTGDIWLRSFGTAGPWSTTQPDSELGIDQIDKLIGKESKSLSDVIEAFLRSPEPPSWIPPSYATPSNQEFLRNLRIPAYLNGCPSLLFHDLNVCDSNEIEGIFGQRRHVYVVMNCTLYLSHSLTTGSYVTRQDRAKLGACCSLNVTSLRPFCDLLGGIV